MKLFLKHILFFQQLKDNIIFFEKDDKCFALITSINKMLDYFVFHCGYLMLFKGF